MASQANVPAGRRARVRRLAGAVAFFLAAVLVLTGLGLVLTVRQKEGWVLVLEHDAEASSADRGGYREVSFGLLGRWRDPGREPPPPVAELEGERVELKGFARPVEGAVGFWLVGDRLAVAEQWKPIVQRSVWVELTRPPPFAEATEGVAERSLGEGRPAPVHRGAFVRARGVLRVGLVEVPGVGAVAFRLEARRLWMRGSRGAGGAKRTSASSVEPRRGGGS